MSQPLPSSEGTVRGWLRAVPAIVALTGQRQYFSMPRQDELVFPFILLYRIGGSPDHFGQDYPQCVFECWGRTKMDADALGRVVASSIIGIRPVRIVDAWMMAGDVNLGPVQTTGSVDAKRYRIDATFHIRSAI